MRFHRSSSVAVCVLAVIMLMTTAAVADEAIRWKLRPEQVFYMQQQLDRQLTTTINGKPSREKSTHHLIVRLKVLKVNDDGSSVIEQKIESAKVIGGDVAERQAAQRMVNGTFEVTYDASMNMKSMKGYDQFIERMANGNAATARVMRKMLTKDAIMQLIAHPLGIVPTKPVSRGDDWDRSVIATLGPLGAYKLKRKMTYKGDVEEKGRPLKQITMQAQIEYQTPDNKNPDPTLPFRVTKGNLKAAESSGAVRFDADKGRTADYALTIRMVGSLTIQSNGRQVVVDLDSHESITAQFLDKRPE